jgi:hypothetical protein
MRESMITTVDNPFNPFDQPDEWYTWDVSHGYYSRELLARIARVSDDMSDADIELITSQAIDDIIRLDLTNRYRKVSREYSEA